MDKLGQKMLGANINVVDDVYHSLQTGSPFSGEGIPRQRVSLVEGGVLKNLVYGRRSASKLGKETTGHGFCEPNPMGEQPMNIVMTGGNSSVEKMIAGSKRAILLTRVWYVREVDPTAKIVTGMTRDGTFLVEDGKVKSGVKNLRFNVGLIDLLNNVVGLGQAIRTAGEEGIPAVVPAIKVENFNFTSSTTF
jgi:predicted Zn-dependent protease